MVLEGKAYESDEVIETSDLIKGSPESSFTVYSS